MAPKSGRDSSPFERWGQSQPSGSRLVVGNRLRSREDETGDIARALVAGGADINIRNERGLTPLHYAVDVAIDGTIQQGLEAIDWSVVGVFLDLGADPSIRDARGETVSDLASAYGYKARRSFDEFMRSRASRG